MFQSGAFALRGRPLLAGERPYRGKSRGSNPQRTTCDPKLPALGPFELPHSGRWLAPRYERLKNVKRSPRTRAYPAAVTSGTVGAKGGAGKRGPTQHAPDADRSF